MSELSGWMLLMAMKSPAMTLRPPGSGPPERITPARIGAMTTGAEPFSKVTAGQIEGVGKKARISLTPDVGREVGFAILLGAGFHFWRRRFLMGGCGGFFIKNPSPPSTPRLRLARSAGGDERLDAEPQKDEADDSHGDLHAGGHGAFGRALEQGSELGKPHAETSRRANQSSQGGNMHDVHAQLGSKQGTEARQKNHHAEKCRDEGCNTFGFTGRVSSDSHSAEKNPEHYRMSWHGGEPCVECATTQARIRLCQGRCDG